MSDYGFATYDERTGKRIAKINSKYPVFGPKYADIKIDCNNLTAEECVEKIISVL